MVKLLDTAPPLLHRRQVKSLGVILKKVSYAPRGNTSEKPPGPFTDVYSCAACFYAALTGFLPRRRWSGWTTTSWSRSPSAGWTSRSIWTRLFLKAWRSAGGPLSERGGISERHRVPAGGGGATGKRALTSRAHEEKLNPVLIGGVAATVSGTWNWHRYRQELSGSGGKAAGTPSRSPGPHGDHRREKVQQLCRTGPVGQSLTNEEHSRSGKDDQPHPGSFWIGTGIHRFVAFVPTHQF